MEARRLHRLRNWAFWCARDRCILWTQALALELPLSPAARREAESRRNSKTLT